MKLLLVEDEQKLSEALAHLLKKNGYVIDTASDGEIGLEMAIIGSYDIIILDRILPSLDGLTLLKTLREQGIETPLLFLTAKDSPLDRVEGLDAGADDYLIKPFSTDELLARLRALSRRRNKALVDSSITVAGFSFDPLKCQVTTENKIIHLSVKESLLLELLLRNQGQVMTKERIFEKVWGYYTEIELANVDLYVHYLRKKLGPTYIKTIRGIGYCFSLEDQDVP